MKVVCIIQARLGSTRLPGKMLLQLHDRPVIEWAVLRSRMCVRVDDTVVATTDQPTDDPLAAWCRSNDVPVYRGSENDVLDRVYQCALTFAPTHVIRATGDAPFNDPRITDRLVSLYDEDPDLEYTSTARLNRMTFPEGIGCECMPMRILSRMAAEATLPSHREHVTPYVRYQPEVFRHRHIEAPPGYADLRLTIDYRDDLEAMSELARRLAIRGLSPGFSLEEMKAVLDEDAAFRERLSGKPRDAWRKQVEAEEGRSLD